MRNIPHCCLPKESGPCLSPRLAGHPLRPATRRRPGRPLPHQLADRPQTHPKAAGLRQRLEKKRCRFPPHPVLARVSPSYPRLWGRLSTCYSTVCRWRPKPPARLAYLRHAASVRPEPGSNSPQVCGRQVGRLPSPRASGLSTLNPQHSTLNQPSIRCDLLATPKLGTVPEPVPPLSSCQGPLPALPRSLTF